MPFTIQPVRTAAEFDVFLRFPWKINRGDPNWVPPLLDARRERLDPLRNPFWKTVERELWLAFLSPAQQPLAYVLAVCTGFGIAAAHVIPWSIMPDVIEMDELETGQRREGTFYGFMVFLQKTGTAFTLALVQWVLHLTGYIPDAAQSPQVSSAIRILFGALPCLPLLPAIFFAWRFPINRAQHLKLREALAEKRAGG